MRRRSSRSASSRRVLSRQKDDRRTTDEQHCPWSLGGLCITDNWAQVEKGTSTLCEDTQGRYTWRHAILMKCSKAMLAVHNIHLWHLKICVCSALTRFEWGTNDFLADRRYKCGTATCLLRLCHTSASSPGRLKAGVTSPTTS
jgi:hypothetical protein